MNHITVTGNLTKDPELRFTETGNAKVSFGIADERRWRDANGEWQGETQFHDVIAWGQLAEHAARVLTKGAGAVINGRIQKRQYEKDGQTRTVTEIVADEVGVLARSIENFERKIYGEGGTAKGAAPKAMAAKATVPVDEPF
jgi:single-strand DNA-binding protein